jgi:hypothetical protein
LGDAGWRGKNRAARRRKKPVFQTDGEQSVDHLLVVDHTAPGANLGERRSSLPSAGTVGSVRGHGFHHIGDADDAGLDENLIALQSSRG